MQQTQLVVIGGGPGGYVAAFKAADLGIQTTLIETAPMLGGVCLRQGCIPSKALLHAGHLVNHAAKAMEIGIKFGQPEIDIDRLREWKQGVVEQLCGGIGKLAKGRKIQIIHGKATFENSHTVRVEGDSPTELTFEHAIIATGSRPTRLPESVIPEECYTDSTGALALGEIPESLALIGGGYIGLELGQVYAALGSRVSIIEMLPQLLPGADADLVRPLAAQLKKEFEAIYTGSRLENAVKAGDQVELTFSKGDKSQTSAFDRVLVCVGRTPNSRDLGLENTGIVVNNRGFIEVNPQRRTVEQHIFAIGDVAGEPMLAHKASREGIIAAENIAGHAGVFAPKAIPAIVYTSPEVAWCGLTETEARAGGIEYKVGKVQWGANGRALTMGRPAGTTKIIADPQSQRVLGIGIVGEHAGDLISEAAVAIELEATVDDLANTIHPHPTTGETIMEAAESVFGRAIHAAR